MATQQAKPSWVSNMEKQKYGRELTNPKSPASTQSSNNPMAIAAQNVKSVQAAPQETPKVTSAANTMASAFNQQPFQFTAPTPFSYNPSSDSALQSYIATARQNLAQNQANTNARLRATGQGKSSYSETVANQLANQASADIGNAMITQFLPQAFQQWQDAANRDFQVQQANYGVMRDQVGDTYTEAELTGNYIPQNARNFINRIVELGELWKSGTPEQKAAYNQEANQLRSTLEGMGIDSSLFGADKTTEQRLANFARVGQRTLAGQAQDYAQEVDHRDFAYQQARDAIADKRYQQEFDEDVRRWGIEYALNKAVQQHQMSVDNAQLAISRMNADTSRMNSALSRDEFEFRKQQENNASNEKMMQEKQGLVNALRGGDITPDEARKQIQEDVRLGFYTNQEAQELLDTISVLSSSNSTPYGSGKNQLDQLLPYRTLLNR